LTAAFFADRDRLCVFDNITIGPLDLEGLVVPPVVVATGPSSSQQQA
jgi:hypothetical protein